MPEVIYVLENEAMPGIIKIGRTQRDVDQRVRELSSSTAVPLPFHCVYAAVVDDAVLVERHIHNAFAAQRIRKEFFRLPAHCVISVLELVAGSIVTPRRAHQTTAPQHQQANIGNVVPFRQAHVTTEQDKREVLRVMTELNRPTTNAELAQLMRVSIGEASKRVKACGALLRKQRIGKFIALTIAPPPHDVAPEVQQVDDQAEG